MPLNNTSDLIRVTIFFHGKSLSAYAPLDETALQAHGPMSLESSCMGLVRELSQELFRQISSKGRGL